jgi:asparagine synthase (glutamine-hydrolysing)
MARFFFIKSNKINKHRISNLKKNIFKCTNTSVFGNNLHNCSYFLFEKSKINANFFEDDKYISIIDGTPHTQNNVFGAKNFLNEFIKKSLKNFLNKLNGGFVGLIYDKKKKIVYTFRDRFGLKPIYIYNKSSLLIVSSQADYIRQYLSYKISVNHQYLLRYSYCNYKSIYGREETIYNDVKMQKMSSLYKIEKNKVSKYLYWNLDKNIPTANLSIKDYSNKLKQIFKNMISNYVSINKGKKFAVALSGGMDSGLISGLLKKYFESPDAVSLTYFDDTEFNEEKLIKESVKKNINHWQDFKLTPKTLLNDLDNNFYKFLDAPLATISIYGYNYLFKSASEAGYDLLYTGSGGDYIQSGNYTNYWYYLADLYFTKNKIFKKELNLWIKNHSTKEFPKSYKTFFEEITKKVSFNHYGKLSSQDLVFDKSIINRELYKDFSFLKSKVVKNYGTYLRSFMMQEYVYDAVAPGVEAEDTMEWINEISLQSPFFDKEIAEFGWVLPGNMKIRNGVNKYLYRRIFKDILPSKIIQRTAKSGFNAPFDQWSRNELKEFIMDIFTSNSFKKRSIYNYKNFMKIVESHMKNENNNMMLIWQALNIELWLRDKKL